MAFAFAEQSIWLRRYLHLVQHGQPLPSVKALGATGSHWAVKFDPMSPLDVP
jgi:hypothetical protein